MDPDQSHVHYFRAPLYTIKKPFAVNCNCNPRLQKCISQTFIFLVSKKKKTLCVVCINNSPSVSYIAQADERGHLLPLITLGIANNNVVLEMFSNIYLFKLTRCSI